MTARAEGARLALRRLLPCLLLLCLLLPCLLLPAAGAPAQTPVPEMAPRMAPQPAPSVPDQALHQAARTNDVDLAAFALERGAGLELRDQLGNTPLQVAARYGSPPGAELLLQRGGGPAAATGTEAATSEPQA